MKKVLLVGNPNVGKSALFSRLTGVRTTVANYPGTTVSFTRGHLPLAGEPAEVLDVPGTYSLEPTSPAEAVAVKLLEAGADVMVIVVDATHLERCLPFTLQVLERGTPAVVALNVWDDARHRGIELDVLALNELLGVPVVTTVALTGFGVKELVAAMERAAPREPLARSAEERWREAGRIVAQVQRLFHRHHTLLERLQDASVRPLTGLPLAALLAGATFLAVRFLGEGLINWVFDPLFEHAWRPVLARLSAALGGSGFLHQVLIGRLFEGEINFKESFGLLSTGLYIPLAAVLPYVVVFYFVLALLEDSGYLPRLAVLLDVLFHRLGLHGFAVIPMILALGCKVPALLATRVLESRRERFIACTALSLGVPCVPLQALILGLLGAHGLRYVLAVYATLFLVWLGSGLVLHRVLPGYAPELFLEIPPYRVPSGRVLVLQLWARVRGFLREALPLVLGGVLAINALYAVGAFDFLARLAEPVVSGLWGLPREAAAPLVIGVLRKEVGAGLFTAVPAMTPAQLTVGCTVLAVTFPCIAAFVVLLRELGLRGLLQVVAIMLGTAVVVGTLQRGALMLLGW